MPLLYLFLIFAYNKQAENIYRTAYGKTYENGKQKRTEESKKKVKGKNNGKSKTVVRIKNTA